ncbi:PQ loop repeat-domain-containing protein [Elsinoe ampelina]|uniref:PQ loop repeat-domain-containing protein n=1 Tax=Elsinoe ampelina TaxID=302913 RepID=A0A6A6GJQ7_9PEZI|nr:PQ loop repeat-domain-containing protein [Elsinoe ampelina]
MSWHLSSLTQPQLPPHCHPTSDFLQRWSATFHVCVPTPLAFISSVLGTLSIVSWLFAQLPQIYKNYTLASTTGLSIFFLVEWCLGDLTNLLGAIFTNQASWQIIVAGYYCFVDLVLVFQWIWYEHLRHGWTIRSIWSRPQDILSTSPLNGPGWRTPRFTPDEKALSTSTASPNRPLVSTSIQPSSSFSPSPRTILFLACLTTLARASPLPSHAPVHLTTTTPSSTPLLSAGTILSWTSTALYLLSRLPQLYKNYTRRSTSGLSPSLFLAAFFGNLFYSSSILTNPLAWGTWPPYGAGGWAGPRGSERRTWVLAALPFWLGAAGVLTLDAAMGCQFLMYGEVKTVVLAEEVDTGRKRRRWMRVSGYMRGWVPSWGRGEVRIRGRGQGGERRGLMERGERERGRAYGGTSGS